MALIALDKLKEEINTENELQALTEKQWIEKTEQFGICLKTEKELNKLIELYRTKISVIRKRLREDGELIKVVTLDKEGRARTASEIVAEMQSQLDSANNFAAKEKRLIEKLAYCLKEKELRQAKKVNLRSPFNEVNLKAETGTVNRRVE